MTQDHLYRRCAADVHRFAFWLCGDPDQAEDITSETLVRAWLGGTLGYLAMTSKLR